MELDKEETKSEIIVNFNYPFKFQLDNEAKLVDLKAQIDKKLLLTDNEYEIFSKDTQLMIISNELKVSDFVNNSKTNQFTIKAYKSDIIFS